MHKAELQLLCPLLLPLLLLHAQSKKSPLECMIKLLLRHIWLQLWGKDHSKLPETL